MPRRRRDPPAGGHHNVVRRLESSFESSSESLSSLLRQRAVYITSICLMIDGSAGAYANWMPQYYR